MGKMSLTGNSRTRARFAVQASAPGFTDTFGPAIVSAGAYFLWKLDDRPNGTTAEDSTANNADGTYQSGVDGFYTGPGSTTYARFNATGDYVSIADSSNYSLTSGKTNILAIYPTSVTSNQQLMHKMNATGNNYEWTLQISNPGILDLQIYTNSGGALIRRGVTANNTLVANTWNVVSFTIDSTPTGSSTITMNVNNSWKSVTHSGSGGTYTDGNAELRLAQRQDTTSERFDGGMAYAGFLPKLSSGAVDTIMAAADADGWF